MGRKLAVSKAKVIKEKLKDPTKSQRDIAKETWISKSQVARIDKQLGLRGAESEIIDKIIANDLDIVTLWQELLVKRIQETPDKVSSRDVISAIDTWARRVTIFKWDITKPDWWLKEWLVITWN